MNKFARTAAVTFAGAALSVAGSAVPATAAPVITGGLVNVTVTDVLTDTQIQALNGVSIPVAANVCGVSVDVLAADLGPDGTVTDCDASSATETTVTQRRGR